MVSGRCFLMDVQMPELDGQEAARENRRLNRKDAKQALIVAMTENSFTEEIQESLDAEMAVYMVKTY